MTDNKNKVARGLVVAGLSGGSGKSVVAVGLTAALARRGLRLVPFKKGPDYIDAGWLSLAAGTPCYNLDPYLMEKKVLQGSFYRYACSADMVVIEGNRGLYDGFDVSGSCSTAELAVGLNLPVVLVVDCTKTTRTVAALVLGCLKLDERVRICGVVLNRIAGARHQRIVTESIEKYTGVPVIGSLPKLGRDIFSQRHLGIVPFQEHDAAESAVQGLAELVETHLDIDRLLKLAAPFAEEMCRKHGSAPKQGQRQGKERARIGVIRDAAFQFYYRENLEALEEAGGELIEINALREAELPPLDGLYIGGGFPETSARQLADNLSFLESVRAAADGGLPIYAECGGLIYLGKSILLGGEQFKLVGVFPIRFDLSKKPQAHGYTILQVERKNPFYPEGSIIRGHEFRYSRIVEWPGKEDELVFKVERGVGFMGKRDGLLRKNTLALYTHIHALGTPEWATALVRRAAEFKRRRVGGKDYL